MNAAPYQLETDDRPRLGLVVLQADETIEDEFRQIFDPARVRLHVSRVPSGADLTPDTIKQMDAALPAAAALFPQGVIFDAVAYACTSGTSLIGEARVASLIRSACQTKTVTNPLTATFAALRALRATRVGIVSPYTDDIAGSMRANFAKAGFHVPESLSFGVNKEADVARIAPESIIAAARGLTVQTALDAVFLSCTNLRTLGVIDALRQETGVPVLSSNQALAWHMSGLAQVEQQSLHRPQAASAP
jgi:maleate isomerase